MSREAMEAAQDHSGIDDPFGLHILVTIGRFIPADTKEGWCSDRVVAEIAKVDRGSVAAWRDRFLEAGIVETWLTGSGRGTKRWYRFLMPFDTPRHNPVLAGSEPAVPADKPANNPADTGEMAGPESAINQGLAAILEVLAETKQLMAEIRELMAEINGGNGRPRTRTEHHNTNNTNPEHPARAGETSKTGAVLAHFVEKTGISAPADHRASQWRQWIEDLNDLLTLCDDDVDRTCALIDRTIAHMDSVPLTYSRPGSLLNVARRLSTAPTETGPPPDEAARREAERVFDWLVRQGMEKGRIRFKEWGVTEPVRMVMNTAFGSSCIEKITGVNPHQYRQEFVNEYLRQGITAS